ncbi:hypothetical protein OROMI_027103 [Orobanche minor]
MLDPWETLLLSPSLTKSPGLATRTNVVAERTDVVPTEGAAGEDMSIWSMTLRIFLATIVVNYFQWAIQDSNLAKVVTGGIVVLVTSPTVIYHCWYCYVLEIHAKNLRTWTLPTSLDYLRAFLAIMQVLNQKFNGTKPKQVEFIGHIRSELRPFMCINVTYYFLYAVGIYYHLNYKSRFVTLWRLIKQFVSSPLHVTMWKIDRYQRLEDLESRVLELQLDREGQEIADVWLNGDLPRVVIRSLSQGSHVTSMDFHPEEHTLRLVGTDVGNISIWEVGSRKQTAITFKVWNISACSMPFQTTFVKDATISVNRCAWGPDGSKLGVAFSKHIVQIYTYDPKGELGRHLELDAHAGGVNDIAFARLKEQLCIVTCGDDKTIKVWDADFGRRQHTFGGHEAPVYSVCLRPHYNENGQFIIFSTATDGKIKAWQYDSLGSRGDYDAPGLCCTTMAYSLIEKVLFSCRTSKEGESHLVEWNESKGTIKRTYSGFLKRSLGVVQFDTTQNRFLAAGDEFQIKFWDMDNTNMLTHSECDGELPASPRLRCNKEGSLLAVTTSDNGIKILANLNGQHMLRMLESRANTKRQTADMKRRTRDKIKSCKFTDIADSSQLKTLKLPDSLTASKIVRLLYTNSGLAVLALASNAVHKL